MRIAVKDLMPNPFRHMEKYPIQRDKVEALKTSIGETEFWDNVLARKDGDGYQIAYGHHRLIALRELKIKEVDIPVKDIDDARMIRIMANENMDDWKSSPAVINETVAVAKEFIDGEMAKAETLATADKCISGLFGSEKAFHDGKAQGAGRDVILKFLGGNWMGWMIQNALAIFKDEKEGKIDREAIEKMPSLRAAEEFRRAVKSSNIPKEKQKFLAREIIKQGDATERATVNAVRKFAEDQRPRKETQSQTVITLEQQKFINLCEMFIDGTKDIPKNWDEKAFQRVKGLVNIIIKRLEVFTNERRQIVS